MKKTITAALAVLFAAALLSACGTPSADGGKITVVTAAFPEYDWVKNIVGDSDGVDVKVLLDGGVDLHSYQPSAADIVTVSTCDVLIYTGGQSGAWIRDAVAESGGRTAVVDLLAELGDRAKREETVEGMEPDADGEESSYDEHVWLSLKNAARLCSVIADRLGEADPSRSGEYRDRAARYIERLNKLDAEYAEAVGAAENKTLVFGDRFPFRYMLDDYGIGYYAAFPGCSAESEASFKTVVFLAGKIDELGLRSVVKTETSDGSLARTVRDATAGKDQKIVTLDSMQTVRADGADYLAVMEENLAALKEALE